MSNPFRMAAATLGCLTTIASYPALAVDISQCAPALIKDQSDQGSTFSSDLRMSWAVTKDDWNKQQQKLGGSGVYDGVPIGGSWEQYQENRQFLSDQGKLSITVREASWAIFETLGENSKDAFEKCVHDL